MLNGWPTVLQTQVKAKGEGVFAGTETRTSAPEHRIIALEAISSENTASHPRHDCPRMTKKQNFWLSAMTSSKPNFSSKFSWLLKRVSLVYLQKNLPLCHGVRTHKGITRRSPQETLSCLDRESPPVPQQSWYCPGPDASASCY